MIEANDAYLQVTRTQREALIGKGVFEVFHDNPSDPEATGVNNLRASLERVVKYRKADTMPIQKYSMEVEGGYETHYWSPHNAPVFGKEGEIAFIIHRVEDVTEFMQLKQQGIIDHNLPQNLQPDTAQMEATIYNRSKEIVEIQESLRLSNEGYQALVSILPVGIFHTDKEGNCLYVNSQWQKITGFDLKNLQDKRWFSLIHPVDQAQVFESWQQLTSINKIYKTEFRFLMKNDQECWVSAEIVPEIGGEKGEIKGYVGSLIDITERKKLEGEREKSETKLRAFLETVPDALVIVNKAGKIILVNTQTERLFNYSRVELLNMVVENLIPQRYQASHESHRDNYFKNPMMRRMGVGIELYGVKNGQKEFPVEISLGFYQSEEETFTLAAIRDITERKHLEKLLKDKELELKERQMQAFYNMGHEFRTPLTLILNPIEEILENANTHQPLTEIQFHNMRMVKNNTFRLLKMINLFLDFSKMEAGHMQLYYQPVDLVNYTSELMSAFRSAIEKAGLALQFDADPLDEPVYIDKELWEKVIFNLLSNALKFTDEGSITVRIKKYAGQVKIQVADSGIGIPQKELPRMFERFHRVEAVHGRYQEGTGIGLAFTKEIIKLHGGDIKVESEDGKGSLFTICIPLGKDHLPAECVHEAGEEQRYSATSSKSLFQKEIIGWLPTEYIPPDQKRLQEVAGEVIVGSSTLKKETILLVDDNADMRQYVVQLLSPFWDVRTAADGEEALEKIGQALPDLVLSDIMMPKMDGITLLKTLRANALTKYIPIVFLSARGDTLLEGLQLRAEDYLVKPFSAKELLARVRTHLELGVLRKQLEEDVKQRTAELIKINQTLQEEANERLKAEAELTLHIARNVLAEEYRQKQEEFIDTLCHEVRNPLTGVYGGVFFLRDTLEALDKQVQAVSHLIESTTIEQCRAELGKAKEQLEIIEACTQYQKEFMDDVLDLSKLENKRFETNPIPFELKQLLEKNLKIFRAQVQQKNLSLELDIPKNENWLLADTHLLSRVVTNLLSNAIKFTEKGGITVSVEIESLSASETVLHFRVNDTGIGMTPAEAAGLFNRFAQANRQTGAKYGGSGLGLTICKKFVELMGGSIRIDSQEQQGTSFYFTIKCAPLSLEEKAKAKAAQQAAVSKENSSSVNLQDRKILVVEDNKVNQLVLVKILEKKGCACHVANDGLEAIQEYDHGRFDLILMDIEMPKMDGLEATQVIRKKEQLLGYRTPIIGLSGYTDKAKEASGFQAGMDDYLTKPYEISKMLVLINELIINSSITEQKLTKEKSIPLLPQFSSHMQSPPSLTAAVKQFKLETSSLLEQSIPFFAACENNKTMIQLPSHKVDLSLYMIHLILDKLKLHLEKNLSLIEKYDITITDDCLWITTSSITQTDTIKEFLMEVGLVDTFGSNISKKAEQPIHLTMQAPSSSTLLQFERSRVLRRPEISSSAANTAIIRPTREREVQNTCCF